jgi:transposase-like protein
MISIATFLGMAGLADGLVPSLSAQLSGYEEMFRERGFEVDHSTINRWVLAYAPMIEKCFRQFRRPHCGSVRIDETEICGKWRRFSGGWTVTTRTICLLTFSDFERLTKREVRSAARLFLPC